VSVDPHALRDIFDQAVGLPVSERPAFLDRACAEDAGLRHAVERLLVSDARHGSVFDTHAPDTTAAGSETGRRRMSLPPSARLGPYQIIATLGAGGMGEVYTARDMRLDRIVALKTLPRELTGDPTARQRFAREARAVAALSHPHICPLFDIGEQDGTVFLVMEYLDGEPLAARLRRGKLPTEDVLTYGIQIADALASAHSAGIVHRDLKPSNIMLTGAGAKLLDFGLAKRRQQPRVGDVIGLQAEPLTHAGTILGTVQYMAPEQLDGRDADERTDIFALGVVLYEMLTGRRAFEGASDAAVIGNILHAELFARPTEHLTSAAPEALVPGSLEHVILKCLEKDAEDRYQSAGELALDLRRLDAHGSWADALSPSVVRRWWRSSAVRAAIACAAVLAVALPFTLNAGGWRARLLGRSSPISIRSVGVLPFANLSGNAQNAYFSDGITEEIFSHLVRIPGLKVVSVRRSSRLTSEPRQVGKEVGVGTVLEGSVRREGNRVRITARLTDTEQGHVLWASEPYDRELSDIFAVQSSVALQIAETLDATLNPKLRESVEQKPTESPDAYDAYLRGTDYYRRGDAERDVRAAIGFFEQAVTLDPKFALAYALLSICHAQMWWYHYDHTPHRILDAKAAIDRALSLQPDLPQVHLALGRYYYFANLDYDRALQQFAIARSARPSDSETLFGTAAVLRRQGKVKEALTTYRQAFELDPRNALLLLNLGETYGLVRDLPEASRALDRAIALSPDWPGAYGLKVRQLLRLGGDTARARETESSATALGLPEDHELTYSLVLLDLFSRSYHAGLKRLAAEPHEAFESQFWNVPKALLQAQFYRLLRQRHAERSHYESAVKLLRAKVQHFPDDPRLRSALGMAYAGLGRKADAIREAMLGVTLMPATKDAYRAAYRVEDLARTYAMVGELDAAVEQLAYLMSIPIDLAAPGLLADPTWDPLRAHAGFQRLVGR
jgi:serine/threonine protein kinase/tetratricopeptide (TPR) repeat protein